jgi:hypothetical protein
MFRRWFLEHPHAVEETYFQHQRAAAGFALALARGAILCLIHGLVPILFQHSASRAVAGLHEQMSRRTAGVNRSSASQAP